MPLRHLEVSESKNEQNDHFSLRTLSLLTGFPVQLIRKELLLDDIDENDQLSMDVLRLAMGHYLDTTMLQE